MKVEWEARMCLWKVGSKKTISNESSQMENEGILSIYCAYHQRHMESFKNQNRKKFDELKESHSMIGRKESALQKKRNQTRNSNQNAGKIRVNRFFVDFGPEIPDVSFSKH